MPSTKKQVVAESEQAQAQVGQQIEELRKEARTKGLDILQTPQGFTIIPVDPDGKPLKGEELTAEERAALEPLAKTINEKLRDIRRYAAQQQMKLAENVEDMNRKVAENAVGGLMEDMEEAFSNEPELVNWLKAMRADILADITRFRTHIRRRRPRPGARAPKRAVPWNGVSSRRSDATRSTC